MKPGSKRTIFGAVLLIGGILIGIVTFGRLYLGTSLYPQYAASGSFTVQTVDAGRYYLWDNYVTWFEGGKVRNDKGFPEEVGLVVRDSQGKELELFPDSEQSWGIGNHAKSSIGYVQTSGSGQLTIDVQGGDGKRVLSFGKADLKNELWRKLGGFAYAAFGILLGLPITLWGLGASASRQVQRETASNNDSVIGSNANG